ncbi:MAG: hypothetical protein K0A89_09085 [ANME-2 cluster archaeon]|nr:hypothetical protein [ANME-2 cluster archaeon]
MGLKDDEKAWADYLITRAGLLVFSAILLLVAFKVPPLFILQDVAGELDADLSSIASFMEGVEGSSLQGARYYHFKSSPEVSLHMSARYLSADSGAGPGSITRARGLMTTVYPANSFWVNRSELLEEIANRCGGRTGIGEDLLLESDMAAVEEMLGQVEAERAEEPFIPDTRQPLVVEKVVVYYDGTDGIERRGITIVYQ